MKDTLKICMRILVSALVCGTILLILPQNTFVGLFAALVCLLFGSFAAYDCLRANNRDNRKHGYTDKWLNCVFLLKNYEVTEKNRELYGRYLRDVEDNIPKCPPLFLALKCNRLLKAKGFEDHHFSIPACLRIYAEALGLGCITAGVSGLLAHAFPIFLNARPFMTVLGVWLVLSLAGSAIHLFLVSDSPHKVFSIVSAIVSVVLVIAVLITGAVRANRLDARCDDMEIRITEKIKTNEKSSYRDGYLSAFKMQITNEKTRDILQLKGEMRIYNLNGVLLDEALVTINDEIPSGTTRTLKLTVDRHTSVEAIELYYSATEDLRITFKITEIIFKGYRGKDYPNSRLMEVLALPDTSPNQISTVEKVYQDAIRLYTEKQYDRAKEHFLTISDYKLCNKYISLCDAAILEEKQAAVYTEAKKLMSEGKYAEAIEKFANISGYKDTANQIKKCEEALAEQNAEAKYLSAKQLYAEKDYVKAYAAFYAIREYKDSTALLYAILDDVNALAESYAEEGNYTAAHDLLKSMGYVTTAGRENYSELMEACAAAKSGNYQKAAARGLSKIIIPDGTESIRNSAFEGCSTLREVVIPESVTSIEMNAFKNCTSLETLILPKDLKTIGASAFVNCDSLKNLVLPASLTSISLYGLNSFDGEIHYEGTMAEWKALEKTGPIRTISKTVYCKDGNVNP